MALVSIYSTSLDESVVLNLKAGGLCSVSILDSSLSIFSQSLNLVAFTSSISFRFMIFLKFPLSLSRSVSSL